MLPWFSNGSFPLYLAPMAGVSDKIFRQLCKERGADVLVTEFVSSEGVFRRNARTRGYLEFDEMERPVGVQLFGGNAEHMAEAARQVVEWVQPDFIDLNFGCPVNKVVAKNGGSALAEGLSNVGPSRRGGRSRGRAAAGDGENSDWLGRAIHQCDKCRATLGIVRHRCSRGPRSDPGAGIFWGGRLGRDRAGRGGGFDSGHRQWRYQQCG